MGGGRYNWLGYPFTGDISTDFNTWHNMEIKKVGNTYGFWYDDTHIATFDDPETPPSQIFWTGGYFWNFPGDRETGELWFDDIKVEVEPIPEPSTVLLLANGIAGMAGYSGVRFRRKRKG